MMSVCCTYKNTSGLHRSVCLKQHREGSSPSTSRGHPQTAHTAAVWGQEGTMPHILLGGRGRQPPPTAQHWGTPTQRAPQSQADSSSRTGPHTHHPKHKEHPATSVQGAHQCGLCRHRDPQKERFAAGLYLPQPRHGALPSSCRRSLALSTQPGLCVQWEMSQGKDIRYLCIFVWHEELFTRGPAPSIAAFLPAAPGLVLTQSQHQQQPSSSHTAFGKLWKGCGAEEPMAAHPLPSLHPFQRKRKKKEHRFFLLKIFFKQTNSQLFFLVLFPSFLMA